MGDHVLLGISPCKCVELLLQSDVDSARYVGLSFSVSIGVLTWDSARAEEPQKCGKIQTLTLTQLAL